MLTLFTNNLLPIILTAVVGYLLGNFQKIDTRTLSRAVFFVFSPCLVFILLTENELAPQAIASVSLFTIISILIFATLAWGASTLFKFPRKLTVALILSVMFTNAGNYGLSLTKFAFGEDALAMASIYFVTTSIAIYTIGILVASMGEKSLKDSFSELYKYPTLYAVGIAILFKVGDLSLPVPIERSVSLLAEAAIPTMLLLLGLQLRNTRFGEHAKALGVGLALRLLVAPFIAITLANLLNLEGAAFQAGVIEASLPTAVMITVLTAEFDAEPNFATAMVTIGTILSPLTITPLLAFLAG